MRASSGPRARLLLTAAAALAAAQLQEGAPQRAQAGKPPAAEQALARAFPGCRFERDTAYLTADERRRAAELAGGAIEQTVVFPYLVRAVGGKLLATAYFDTHRVRTLREVLLVAIAPDATILDVEVLAFLEPKEYLPRESWYRQLEGRALAPELNLRRGIDGVSGATLTARATVDCARRVLALHRVLAERQAAPQTIVEAPAKEKRPEKGAQKTAENAAENAPEKAPIADEARDPSEPRASPKHAPKPTPVVPSRAPPPQPTRAPPPTPGTRGAPPPPGAEDEH